MNYWLIDTIKGSVVLLEMILSISAITAATIAVATN